MDINPAGFQEAAAKTAVDAFRNGRRKYLIADETGLGKTIIARTIIEKMTESMVDTPFIVYYFGSNLMLLDNTIEKLRKGKEAVWEYHKEAPKKLGMMAGESRPKSGVHIYGFSASLLGKKGSDGDGDSNDSEKKDKERPLYMSWRKYEEINKKYFAYAEDLEKQKKIETTDWNVFSKLWDKGCVWKSREDITVLRKVFEFYTLEKNPPNLIIFDELHRYDKNVVEFVGRPVDWSKTKILFLSATPYNYYQNQGIVSSVAEDEGDNEGGTISSFSGLLELLKEDAKDEILSLYDKFKNKEMRNPLEFSDLLKKNYIYRNERLSDGTQKYQTLPTIDEFQNVFLPCFDEEKWLNEGSNSRYRKLCSGVYSFPIKKFNSSKPTFYQGFDVPSIGNSLFEDDFVFKDVFDTERNRTIRLKRDGFFWQNLRFACIKHYNAKEGRGLLWVPPTMPEYKLQGRFEGSSFSKLMIFSAYRMVPRIVSGVFSAYVADDIGEISHPVDMSEIDTWMEEKWNKDLMSLADCYDECRNQNSDKKAEEDVEGLISGLALKIKERKQDLSEDELLLSAKYIVGSPYMCAIRAFGQEAAGAIREKFNAYFKKEGIKQAICYCGITDAKQLLDYCIDGGLGAVLREYRFSGGEAKDLIKALSYGTAGIEKKDENACSRVYVYSMECYDDPQDAVPIKIPCHYAERFNEDYTDTGASETSRIAKNHFQNCHNAFNSPFWPMILCTTSANQEGYDLDRYCNRIMHYSLPANTMAFEQRDGRIDRRLSLLARKRMVQLYGSSKMTWEKIFANDEGESGMSPYWTQMGYMDKCAKLGLEPLKFERVVPYFPMTREYLLYRQLLIRKNEYRGHFGLPNEAGHGIEEKEVKLKLNDI